MVLQMGKLKLKIWKNGSKQSDYFNTLIWSATQDWDQKPFAKLFEQNSKKLIKITMVSLTSKNFWIWSWTKAWTKIWLWINMPSWHTSKELPPSLFIIVISMIELIFNWGSKSGQLFLPANWLGKKVEEKRITKLLPLLLNALYQKHDFFKKVGMYIISQCIVR